MIKLYKKAFTLSETLIVLAVIGLISAMVTPAIINSMPKKTIVNFKKDYYALYDSIKDVANNSMLYIEKDEEKPILLQPNKNFADVKDLLGLPSGSIINENNYLCHVVAANLLLKDSNCNMCSKSTDRNFTLADNTRVYGLCGKLTTGSRDVILYVDPPENDNKKGYDCSDSARTSPSKTHCFRVALLPQGSLTVREAIETKIMFDATSSHTKD